VADWVTISSLSTAGGTLVLAVATFAGADLRRLTRDLYVAAGDVGFWQGVFRDPNDPEFLAARAAIEARERLTVDVLYGDHEGGQRVISRFGFWPREDGRWMAGVARHWNIDRSDPR